LGRRSPRQISKLAREGEKDAARWLCPCKRRPRHAANRGFHDGAVGRIARGFSELTVDGGPRVRIRLPPAASQHAHPTSLIFDAADAALRKATGERAAHEPLCPRNAPISREYPATSAARDRGKASARSHPSHPSLRRPSSRWAWSSDRYHGGRPRTYMSNAAGATAIAFSSATFASSVRPSCPSAAARKR
jgi:hypothetical protein